MFLPFKNGDSLKRNEASGIFWYDQDETSSDHQKQLLFLPHLFSASSLGKQKIRDQRCCRQQFQKERYKEDKSIAAIGLAQSPLQSSCIQGLRTWNIASIRIPHTNGGPRGGYKNSGRLRGFFYFFFIWNFLSTTYPHVFYFLFLSGLSF